MLPLQTKTTERLFLVPTTRALRTSATTAVRTLRVAVYLRISSDREGEELGVSRQREDCNARAVREDWSIVHEYVDKKLLARGLPDGLVLTPATTTDAAVARTWMLGHGASGVEGIVAKRLDPTYRPGVRAWHKRTGQRA